MRAAYHYETADGGRQTARRRTAGRSGVRRPQEQAGRQRMTRQGAALPQAPPPLENPRHYGSDGGYTHPPTEQPSEGEYGVRVQEQKGPDLLLARQGSDLAERPQAADLLLCP